MSATFRWKFMTFKLHQLKDKQIDLSPEKHENVTKGLKIQELHMKHFAQWTWRQVISLIPIKKKESINVEGEDQQPDATLNASCKRFHRSHVCLPSSSQIKQLLGEMTYGRREPSLLQRSTDESCVRRQEGGGSTHSPPSQPVPGRSPTRPSPRTAALR